MLIYGASLVAQMVKNLPSMWETWVRSLGWEDPWRRKWLPTPVFFPGEFHGQRSLAGYSLWSYKESDVTEWLTLSLFMLIYWPIDLVGRYFWLFNFLEEFVYNWYYFFLKCLVEFTSKIVWNWYFPFFGRQLIIDSVSSADIQQFLLSVSSCVSFGGLCFSRNWSVSSELSNMWTRSCS